MIYALCQPETGEVRYVGKTNIGITQRYKQHLSDSKRRKSYVYTWIRSLEEKPHIVVLEENPADINEAEKYWIAFYRNIIGDKLCNLTDGGDGISPGTKMSAETRAKMSIAQQNMSAEHRLKLSAAGSKRRHSEETKAKISAGNKGKHMSEESKAKMSASARVRPPVSNETRAKISASGTGRIRSAEAIAKTVAFHTGKKRSAETKTRISIAAKRRWAKEKEVV